jgi:acyl-CoA thioesterase-2
MPTRGGLVTESVSDLLRFLDLEQIDDLIYRGWPGVWPKERQTIFGGEVAAQALRAAAATVDPDRRPHSLHGYFLRRGDPSMPVVFVVDRDRDGLSFSARRVAAMQRGEVIWEMSCSFHVAEEGPEFIQPVRPELVLPGDSPEQLPRWSPLLEVRLPPPPDGRESPPGSHDRVWTRVRVTLPDDPIIHACMHAFTSDISSGFGDLAIDGIPPGGPSIDHALWFHHPTRADDWVIYDCVPAKVGGRRGLYTGTAHDLDGHLVAMLAQEMLLRPPRPVSGSDG